MEDVTKSVNDLRNKLEIGDKPFATQIKNEQRVTEGTQLFFHEACNEMGFREEMKVISSANKQMLNIITQKHQTVLSTGQSNTGKTEITRHILSLENQPLTQSGVSIPTQRITCYYAEDNPDIKKSLIRDLEILFGPQIEELSDDPRRALEQYTDASRIDIPLIKGDSKLKNMVLIDTMDTERKEEVELTASEKACVDKGLYGNTTNIGKRQLTLLKAMKLASTCVFFVDWNKYGKHDAYTLLESFMAEMPNISYHLFVNMIRPNGDISESELLMEPAIERILKLGVKSVFGAQDTKHRDYRYKEYQELLEKHTDVEGITRDTPVAYELRDDQNQNQPKNIDPKRLLANIGGKVKPSEALQIERVKSQWSSSKPKIEASISKLKNRARNCETLVRSDAVKALELAHEFSHKTDGQPIHPVSENYKQKLSKSLLKHAPAPIKASYAINRTIAKGATYAKEQGGKVLGRSEANEALPTMGQQSELNSILIANRLMDIFPEKFTGKDRVIVANEVATSIIKKTMSDTMSLLDGQALNKDANQRLEEAAKQIWKDVPNSRKFRAGLTAFALTGACLGAVTLIPFDAGASAVGVASASTGAVVGGATTQALTASAIAGASAKTGLIVGQATSMELLAAAGLGGLTGGGAAANSLENCIQEQLFQPYYTSLLANIMDQLGIPRYSLDYPIKLDMGLFRKLTINELNSPISAPHFDIPVNPWLKINELELAEIENICSDITKHINR